MPQAQLFETFQTLDLEKVPAPLREV